MTAKKRKRESAYATRRAAGLCGRCGSNPSESAYCETCAAARADERNERRRRARRAGRCPMCDGKRDDAELVNCSSCQEANNVSSRASHERGRRTRGVPARA